LLLFTSDIAGILLWLRGMQSDFWLSGGGISCRLVDDPTTPRPGRAARGRSRRARSCAAGARHARSRF